MAMNSLSPNTPTKTFHIYLRDEVLFKDLDQYEFDLIWGRIYKSYYKDDLTYEEINFDSDVLDGSY